MPNSAALVQYQLSHMLETESKWSNPTYAFKKEAPDGDMTWKVVDSFNKNMPKHMENNMTNWKM